MGEIVKRYPETLERNKGMIAPPPIPVIMDGDLTPAALLRENPEGGYRPTFIPSRL